MPEQAIRCVSAWLDGFGAVVRNGQRQQVSQLFDQDGSWRDMLAISGDLRTLDGVGEIEAFLDRHGGSKDFRVTAEPQVEYATRFGRYCLEAFFDFDTGIGYGRGIARFICDEMGGPARRTAWTVLTTLHSLKVQSPSKARAQEPTTAARGPDQRRNWLEVRHDEQEYADRDPTVVVVGAGQCGLSMAARLKELDIDTLVIERTRRIGDSWRLRYRSLRLHNETCANHLPYIPFPSTWPKYLPKDKLANWLEFYADSMELNVWTASSIREAKYDEDAGTWSIVCEREGVRRVVRPKHLVLAIGVSRIPKYPEMPGLADFSGITRHAHDYVEGTEFRGLSVLVVGSGNSGHDVAQDLYVSGANVTMMQRGSTTIVSLEPGAEKAAGGLYRQNRPIDDLDLIRNSATYPVRRQWLKNVTDEILDLDRDLIRRLHAVGFKTDTGADGTGFLMKYWRQGGGYYIDVGCSKLIIDGKIQLVQFTDLESFTQAGVRLVDGCTLEFDVVIFASGYMSIQDGVRSLLSDEVADRVGPVWGLDDEGELRNICKPTAQPGLWFIGGSLIEARSLSRYMALQIQAAESGVAL